MAPGVNFVSKDGWSSVSYGWTCSHCGLERLWFSSKQCRRCGAPKPNGAQSSPAAAAQVPRRIRKRGARPTQKPSTPPEYNLAKVLDGLKDNEHFKDSEELAAMQAKMEQAWEADKLAKRQARTPEVAVQAAFSALQNRKAAMAKSQAKISELEEAAQKAAEAVEEAKQKAEKLQGEIDKLSKEYDEELARLVKPSDPVSNLQSNVRAAFQALSGNPEAQPLIAQLETAFTGLSSLLAAATPTPHGDRGARQRGTAAGQREGHLARGVGRCQSLRAVAAGFARRRARGQESEDGGVRPAIEAGLAISNATSTLSTVRVAFMRPQARDRASNPSPRFWSGKDSQFESPISRHPGQLPRPTSHRGNLDS